LLTWRTRGDCPEPAGLVAAGAAMRAVLHALRQRDAEVLHGLSLAATHDLLVLLGPAERLPWADGVRYCAPAAGVPGLWLPTRREPASPAELLHLALQRRAGHSALLLWDEPAMVLGLDQALPVQPGVLDWLERACA